ncbi:MAG: hypothetical protein LBK91_02685 [Synergistaceae bacterium]|nr:hypothetical protein [Synergistaceae bacterium]
MSKKIQTAAAVLILVAVTAFILKARTPEQPVGDNGSAGGISVSAVPPESIPSTADSIPAVSGGDAHFFMKTADTESLFLLISAVTDIFGADMSKSTRGGCDFVKNFLSASDELSVSAKLGSGFELYASMFVDEEKFDALIAEGNGGAMRAEKLETSPQGEGAVSWTLRPAGWNASKDVIYVTKRRSQGRNLVNCALSPLAAGEMKLAEDDPSKRFKIERNTEGENFALLKLTPEAPASSDVNEFITGELSWDRNDLRIHIRTFTDIADYMRSGRLRRVSDFVPSEPVIAGDGDPVLFVSVDPMFVSRAAFPDKEDPVRYMLDAYFWKIPSLITKESAAVLRRSRIYAVATSKVDALDTAYVMLESDERGAVGRLYALAGVFLGSPVKIVGWDSAYNVISAEDREYEVILGRIGNSVILGAGKPAAYGTAAEPPPEIKKIASPSNSLAAAVSSKILSVKIGKPKETLLWHIEKFLREHGSSGAVFNAANLKKIDSFSLTETPGGMGEIYITLKELEK